MDGRGQAAGVAAVGVGDEDAVDFRLARAGVLIEGDLLAVGLVVGVDHGDRALELAGVGDCVKHYPGRRVRFWEREKRDLATIGASVEVIDGYLSDYAVMISGSEPMISELTDQLLATAVSRGLVWSERAVGLPGKWDVASLVRRHFRIGTTCFFGFFVKVVGGSVVARAIVV